MNGWTCHGPSVQSCTLLLFTVCVFSQLFLHSTVTCRPPGVEPVLPSCLMRTSPWMMHSFTQQQLDSFLMGINPQRETVKFYPSVSCSSLSHRHQLQWFLGLVIPSGNLFLHCKSMSKGPDIRQVLALMEGFVLLSITALSYANRLGIISCS